LDIAINNLLGVVLCGGKSSRMGTDKGLILHSHQPWAVIVAQKFKAINLAFVVSINNTQTNSYQACFNKNILVNDNQTIPGPLRGLLTVHQKYPEKNLLVLACDMIDMQPKTICTLINNYIKQPNFDFYAYHNGDFWEPFCGIYTAKGLGNLVLKNETNASLQHTLTLGPTHKSIILDTPSFKNYNTYY
jgi:molybdenum cofactor guanylyltransferase